jgi:hypothetical protein
MYICMYICAVRLALTKFPSLCRLVTAYPTTPPAGPERIALLPRNEAIGVRPVDICMYVCMHGCILLVAWMSDLHQTA